MRKIKHSLFWPPVTLLVVAIGLNLYDRARFESALNALNGYVLAHFGGGFAWVGLVALVLCVFAGLSPLGRVRLGGQNAKPHLSFWSWASIVLCTNTGAGILFWSIAEPMYHLGNPPESLGLAPGSLGAARFALSTLFLHWSFTPSAIYTLPALVFGISYFNLKQPFSLTSCLVPAFGKLSHRFSVLVDGVALFTLVLGMAAALDTGILSLAGGLQYLTGIPSTSLSWISIGGLIVVSFILSSLSGVEKGIKFLSNLNSVFFFILAVFIFAWGAPLFVSLLGLDSLSDYVTHFFGRSLFYEYGSSDHWPEHWTIFYWAVWMAWAPVTAGFLGRVGYGYTVRQFLLVNIVFPSLFAIFWMTIFAGTTIHMSLYQGFDLVKQLKTSGPESLAYTVLSQYPMASVIIPVFLVLVFISYVTAADSNTLAMSTLCSKDVDQDNPKPYAWLPIFWGFMVGAIALTLLTLSGIEGIKTLSYLGGVPAMVFVSVTCISLFRMAVSPQKFGLLEDKAPVPPVTFGDPALQEGV